MAADRVLQLVELGVALLVAAAVAVAVAVAAAVATADGALDRARFLFLALIALALLVPLVAEALLVGDEGLDTPAPPEAELGLVGDEDELLGGALGPVVVVGVGVGVGVAVADWTSTMGACSVTVTVTVLGMGDGAAVAVEVDGLDDGAVGAVDAPLGLTGTVGTTPPTEVEGKTDVEVPGIAAGSGSTGAVLDHGAAGRGRGEKLRGDARGASHGVARPRRVSVAVCAGRPWRRMSSSRR